VRRTLSKAKRRLIREANNSDVQGDAEKFVLADHKAEKTDEQFSKIEEWVSTNFLFHHMTPKQKKDAVSCMEKVDVVAEEYVIKQGEMGDKFYIIESGKYDVLVRDDEGVMQSVFG
jgi:CRP-like cAMP-binding protein